MVGRPQPDAAAEQRPAARCLRFAATRDGSALRLHVLTASTLDSWQVRRPFHHMHMPCDWPRHAIEPLGCKNVYQARSQQLQLGACIHYG